MHSEFQTALDKGRDRGVAFLGRDTGLCMLTLVVCFCQQQRARVPHCSRQPESAGRAPVSLSKNAAPLSRPLSTAVWSLMDEKDAKREVC
ncbi:hypothetical protein Y032_0004g2122 [Ancylostoma ceylanicum]|uniref:Uncharacterized protein n=1 Tax=Ancylostoma ceylanicum TaxID=53326 RepID=A0A016VVD4_9BILA|nr:hypothetical protein Y032_0004g2122 [Ancylostoma ceylanicum]